MDTNCRISLFKKERPQQAAYKVDRLHARDKPAFPVIIFNRTYHHCNKNAQALMI